MKSRQIEVSKDQSIMDGVSFDACVCGRKLRHGMVLHHIWRELPVGS